MDHVLHLVSSALGKIYEAVPTLRICRHDILAWNRPHYSMGLARTNILEYNKLFAIKNITHIIMSTVIKLGGTMP